MIWTTRWKRTATGAVVLTILAVGQNLMSAAQTTTASPSRIADSGASIPDRGDTAAATPKQEIGNLVEYVPRVMRLWKRSLFLKADQEET
jgi:hypothetical protein